MSNTPTTPDMGDAIVSSALNNGNVAYDAPLNDRQAPPAPQPPAPPDQSIGGVNNQQPAQQPQAQGPQKPSLWKSLLAGALNGLAASQNVNAQGVSGGDAFAAGLANGVGAQLAAPMKQQQAQAQLDNEKAATAFHYVNLQKAQRELNLMADDKREAFLSQAADEGESMMKNNAITPLSQPADIADAQATLQKLHAANPWAVYSIVPTRDSNGDFKYMAVQFSKAPTQTDLPLKGAGPNGEDITIPAGTPADQVAKCYTNFISKKLDNQAKQERQDSASADRSALADKNNQAKAQRAPITATGQNVVAFDPEYQNPDGSKGGNVVLDKATAQQRGLFNYKADPSTINSLVGGMNDVQIKLNSLADVVNDTKRMQQVDPKLAAAMLNPTTGVNLSFGGHGGGASAGIGLATDRINAWLNNANVKDANQATKDYVAAFIGAHEAITQLPRLQTFGKSSRMTETQLHAALNLLPQPGDTASFAQQKMQNLQTMIDPLRKQIPHMPGADLIPSWLEY